MGIFKVFFGVKTALNTWIPNLISFSFVLVFVK